jgi:hypothetical protein
VSVDYEDAVIETRSSVERGAWSTACRAPCDRSLMVEDTQLRVVAPQMTASNEFRVAPGSGTARLRVSGGSATARGLGLAGLLGGIPLSLGGGALFGYGAVSDREGMQTAGIVALAVGATAVVAALPLLLVGSTRVRDARGRTIARASPPAFAGAF